MKQTVNSYSHSFAKASSTYELLEVSKGIAFHINLIGLM